MGSASFTGRARGLARAFLVAGLATCAAPGGSRDSLAVVDRVAPRLAAESAGLRAGDVLVGWTHATDATLPAAPRSITDALDLDALEIEEAPRGPLTLHVLRGNEPLALTLPAPPWGILARPPLPEDLLAQYLEGKAALDAGHTDEAVRLWRALLGSHAQTAAWRLWLHLRAAGALDRASPWPQSAETVPEACAEARATATGRRLGYLMLRLGERSERDSRLDDAGAAYREALDALGEGAAHSLLGARILLALGRVAYQHDDLAAAEPLFRRAAAIRNELAPDSLDVADSLAALGTIAYRRGDLGVAADCHGRALAIRERRSPESLPVAQSLVGVGNVAFSKGDLDTAQRHFERALAIRKVHAPESAELANSLNSLGALAFYRGDLITAEKLYGEALAIVERRSPFDQDVAHYLTNLGSIAIQRKNLASAEAHHRRALAIRERQAPESLAVADSLESLGLVAAECGRPEEAAALHRRALALRERLAPDSLDVASSYVNLAGALSGAGDLLEAERLQRRALAIAERRAPESLHVGAILAGLGDLLRARGDLAVAERYYRRAVAVMEKLAQSGFNMAAVLNSLGQLALSRHDLRSAADRHRRALAMAERQASDGDPIRDALDSLAIVAQRSGDLAEAETLQRRSLALAEKQGLDHVGVVLPLVRLGHTLQARGDLAGAREHIERALDIAGRHAAESRAAALAAQALADLHVEQRSADRAEPLLRRALEILRQLAPGTTEEAEVLLRLARLRRAGGAGVEALALYQRAVDALESQERRLGGSEEERAEFGAGHGHLYAEYTEALIEAGRTADAYRVVERGRVRTMLEMIAEREILFGSQVPGELELRRRRLAREYERTQSAMRELDARRDSDALLALNARLEELRAQRQDIVDRVRAASPRLAALRYPRSLDAAGLQGEIDADTVVLAYVLGPARSHVFAIDRSGVRAHPLPWTRERTTAEVERFRRLLLGSRTTLVPGDPLWTAGAGLYDALVRPAEEACGRARRLLIIPDGSLHLLPFSAVIRTVDGTGTASSEKSWEYLIEWRALHSVASGTLYSELRRRPRVETSRVVAFGDPRYAATASAETSSDAEAALRSALDQGLRLEQLPGTRREVADVLALFEGQGTGYVGPEATEERVKTLPRDVRYVHFGCHAWIDERFPLDSALALAAPENQGSENGFLQAWEIIEHVHMNADLVVLSACGSALGRPGGGEGLIGLTRAFQYAGARSIVAALWSVSDRSTAQLMRRFYGALKQGASKDEALRAAQLELIAGGGAAQAGAAAREHAHPFHWAAFELIGDWR